MKIETLANEIKNRSEGIKKMRRLIDDAVANAAIVNPQALQYYMAESRQMVKLNKTAVEIQTRLMMEYKEAVETPETYTQRMEAKSGSVAVTPRKQEMLTALPSRNPLAFDIEALSDKQLREILAELEKSEAYEACTLIANELERRQATL